MAAHENASGGPRQDGQAHETTPRRLREQSQRDFELDFFEAVLRRDPYNPDVLRRHASNLAAVGQYGQALQADRRLTRLKPDRPIPWYNLACSYAVLGMIEPAFAALQRACDLGYLVRHRRQLLRDPDLAGLRQDPRFFRLFCRG